MAARFVWINLVGERVRAVKARDEDQAKRFLLNRLWVTEEVKTSPVVPNIKVFICTSLKVPKTKKFIVLIDPEFLLPEDVFKQ